MNATDERGHDAARERLLDVALEQVFADGALRAGAAAPARRSRWLVAAGVLLGLGVVAAVAWQARSEPARFAVEPQDPTKPQEPRPTEEPRVLHVSELSSVAPAASDVRLLVDGTDGLVELPRLGKVQRLVFVTMPTWGNKPPERNEDPAVLAPLRELRSLEQLHLCSVLGMSAAHLGHLRELPALRQLGLDGDPRDGDKLDAATREVLFSLPHVRSLSLRMFAIDADLLTGLRAMKLTELQLDACEGFDAAVWRALAELKTLRSLRITSQDGMAAARPELPDAAFDAFAALPDLMALDLDECAFAGSLMSRLPAALQKLDLGDYVMTADTIGALKRLSSLHELAFNHNVLTDPASELLAVLPLEVVRLRGWSDQGTVAAIARHPMLREVWVRSQQELDLTPLADAPRLRKVHLLGEESPPVRIGNFVEVLLGAF